MDGFRTRWKRFFIKIKPPEEEVSRIREDEAARLISDAVDSLGGEMVEFFQEIVRIPTENPPCRGACYMTPIDGVRSISYDPPQERLK